MRADKFLAENNYYESRSRARAAIEAGLVFANGVRVEKPSLNLDPEAIIEATHPHPWVSRAGIKLAYALAEFNVSARGRTCIDVGASTGGFTDVLINDGAAFVYAVDVGTGQLHKRIHSMDNVMSMEQTDARSLTASAFREPPQLIVCDVSFISCMKALEVPLSLSASDAELITLVKPQFEVGRDNIGKGGIVRDKAIALNAVARVREWLENTGWQVKAEDVSPIKGGAGNTEYLIHARRGNAD